jgi:hypothetical protein
MAKKAKPRHGKPPVVNYTVGGPSPQSFGTQLTPEQLAQGNEAFNTILQQACVNTTQKEMIVAGADWLR